MDTKHKQAIKSILEGTDIKSAAEWEGMLPDTLIKFLTANFQITGNSSVKDSNLYQSFMAYQRSKSIEKRLERIRANISALLSEGAQRLKASQVDAIPKLLNLMASLATTVEIELRALVLESIELEGKAEFYKEALK